MLRLIKPLWRLLALLLLTLSAAGARAQDYCDPSYMFNPPNSPPLGAYNVSNLSHLVVMEYGVYKGQNAYHIRMDMAVPSLATGGPAWEVVTPAHTNPDGTVTPAVYGWWTWYESGSCQVLGQHAAWMLSLGVDAILLDNSNINHCVFRLPDDPDICGPDNLVQTQTVKANLAALYKYYHDHQVPIRIIPMIDGQLGATLDYHYPNGETPLQRALQFFHDLSVQYPELPVMYKGRPLLTTYIGVPWLHVYNGPGDPLYNFLYFTPYKIGQLGMQNLFTYRIMSAVAEAGPQCVFWDTYTSASNPTVAGLRRLEKPTLPRPPGYSYFQYPIWSFLDRFTSEVAPGPAPVCDANTVGGAPTYSVDPDDNKPENFVVTSAFPGSTAAWWEAPDAGLRDTTAVLDRFMQKAKILKPRFLLLSQFNEFGPPDQGNTTPKTNDIEPTSSVNGGPGWGNTFMDQFRARVGDYKSALARPINFSSRGWIDAHVKTGDFVIAGPGPKRVLIRGMGKGLECFGVSPGLPNACVVLLRLRDDLSAWDVVDSNDSWAAHPRASEIPLPPPGACQPDPSDAAMVATLRPGTYSVYMYDSGGGQGYGVVTIDELNDPAHPELASAGHPFKSFASYSFVRSANDPVYGGLITSGDQPQTMIITATGPSLGAGGLADPMLTLLGPGGQVLATNDNWQSSPNAAQIQASGHAPPNPLEAAIVYTLQPNTGYTVVLSGANGGAGVAFINAYAQ